MTEHVTTAAPARLDENQQALMAAVARQLGLDLDWFRDSVPEHWLMTKKHGVSIALHPELRIMAMQSAWNSCLRITPLADGNLEFNYNDGNKVWQGENLKAGLESWPKRRGHNIAFHLRYVLYLAVSQSAQAH